MFSGSLFVVVILAVFASQDVSGQSTTLFLNSSVMVTPTSTSVPSQSPASSQTIAPTPTSQGSTAAGASQGSTAAGGSASVTTAAPTTDAPRKPTCYNITFVAKMKWNDSYENSQGNISDILESEFKSVFSDYNKYMNVEVSYLTLKAKEGNVQFTFTLCLVFKLDNAPFIGEMLKNFKYNGVEVEGLEIELFGVTYTDWKANDGECSKCLNGGAGPIVLERTCNEKTKCNGAETVKESKACLEYCDSSAAAIRIPSFILAMGILLSFSFNIWK